MLPTLSSSTRSYSAWRFQLDAYFALKSVDEDKQKLAILPACVEESLLIRATSFLSLGTTTYKTAIDRFRVIWLDVRRPSNPEKLFHEMSFSQPSQASDALADLMWLSEYLNYDSKAIRQRFISAAPLSLQPVLIGRATDTTEQLCDFILKCPDDPAPNQVSTVSPVKRDALCDFCKKRGHTSETCRRRTGACLRCGSSSHRVANCRNVPPKNV